MRDLPRSTAYPWVGLRNFFSGDLNDASFTWKPLCSGLLVFDTIMPYYKLEMEYLLVPIGSVRPSTKPFATDGKLLWPRSNNPPTNPISSCLTWKGVHEAELIKWRVSAGDQVAEHQTLAEMETDKALVEVPSPWAGVVTELCGAEGDIINVGSVLVRYGESTGHPPASPASDQTQATESSASEEREDAGTVVGSMNNDGDAPSALTRRRTEAEEVPTEQARALATPAVRGIAKQLGVDINRVLGTGRGGRVTASDVERFAQHGAAPSRSPTKQADSGSPSRTFRSTPQHQSSCPLIRELEKNQRPPVPVDPSGTTEVIPFRGVRRKIAEALDRSVKTAVHFTVVDEADITDLDRKRKEYSAITGRKLSFLPFVIRAVAHGLREHPALNAVVDEAKSEIHRKGNLNLGIAVDSDAG